MGYDGERWSCVLYNCNSERAKTMTVNKTISQCAASTELRHPSESEVDSTTLQATDSEMDTQVRSSGNGIADMPCQLSLLPDDPVAQGKGVGARHRSSPPRRRGGGYQDNCNVFEFSANPKKIDGDPRMAELAAMGLPDYWLKVADYLGFDAFLGMWRILDANELSIPQFNGSNSMSPTLRRYSNYLRFQKNRFVETLAMQGVKPQEIQRRVKAQLCESISITHIQRIAQKHRIKK